MCAYISNTYTPGTYIRQCDVCGSDFLRSELVRRWDGAIVCSRHNYPKPPHLQNKSTIKERPFKKD